MPPPPPSPESKGGGGRRRSSPFGQLAIDTLSERDLRETAYEILVAASRSSGGKPLTFVSHSDKTSPLKEEEEEEEKSLTSAAASKVKRALGIRKKPPTHAPTSTRAVAELIRVQMGISDQADARIRRALLRIAAGQLGRRIESVVLPIEFLQQFKYYDFGDKQEYEACQARHLKILEAGLLLHPHLPLDNSDDSSEKIREIIHKALELPSEAGKKSDSLQLLRNGVISLARRSFDGYTPETYHWADGSPLNFYLYQMLLESCFDTGGSMFEEIDEMLELIKKTWAILGINQMLHNICFLWILFDQFASTGYRNESLLVSADNQMIKVAKDAETNRDPVYCEILYSSLDSILCWAEKQLIAYHEVFHSRNLDLMECVVSLAVTAAKILEEINFEHHRKKKMNVAFDRIDTYIRSSLRAAFEQRMKKARSGERNAKKDKAQKPILSILAKDTGELAFKEKEIFSPVLKRWHPLATGVAVATLHSCYGMELKKFVEGITDLASDTAEVLQAANKLEIDLVEIAVDDSVDSEDGGKAIIQEMRPYEGESILNNLTKTWINTGKIRLKEWVNRNLQLEDWKVNANKENVATSAAEILRMVDDTLEAFFQLPIETHAALIPDLIGGLDESVKHYISAVKSGCGTRSTYIPELPALTRCSASSKFLGWRRKDKSTNIQNRNSLVGTRTIKGSGTFTSPELCLRLNTVFHIRVALENLEKRISTSLKKLGTFQLVENGVNNLTSSLLTCQEGIEELSEALAYRTVFYDLSQIFLDGLYVGDVASSRIEVLLQELDPTLEMISSSLHDKVRHRAITATMIACFEAFLLVLLAGGPSRAFSCPDFQFLQEDFQHLRELFLADGDGIPPKVVNRASTSIRDVLPLFQMESATLIEKFKQMVVDAYGPTAKSKPPLPPTTPHWSSTEPHTILRVLCHRNDEAASKFLKKTYHLPKRL